ncbi:unnamed protein product, partial [Cyprideis torosa]
MVYYRKQELLRCRISFEIQPDRISDERPIRYRISEGSDSRTKNVNMDGSGLGGEGILDEVLKTWRNWPSPFHQ